MALRDALKGRLLQLEEALFVASGQRFEAESEAAAEAAYLDATGVLPADLCVEHPVRVLGCVLARVPMAAGPQL